MDNSTGGGNISGLLALAIFFLGVVSPVRAGQFAYGLGYTMIRSDNIARVPATAGERDDTINSYLFGFSYLEQSSDVIARVLGQAEFRDYREEIFGDETVYNLKSSLLWTISPQRFTWTVEDTYDKTLITPTVADTPENRTNVNVFSTGPDVYIRFNPLHTLALGARAGNVDTSRANTDNDRFVGSARWLYQATPASTYSLNFEILDVSFDDSTLNNNFVNHDVFFRTDYRPSRSQYIIDLGATRISPDRGETLDETLARFSWNRQLTQESTIGVSASGEFSDTGSDLLATSTSSLPVAPQTAGVVTSDVYYTKRGDIYYTHRGSEVMLAFSLFAQDLDFETTPQDRKENGGRIRLDYFYSGTTTVTLSAERISRDYLDFVRRDTDLDADLRLTYRVTRFVSLGLGGRRVQRSSTDPGAEFDENRVFLSILYSSSPYFSPVAAR